MSDDDETIATSTTGMMTPTSTVTCCSISQEIKVPTITILVDVLDPK
ncbi:unnamed protein product [Aureobasidium vineae]|uniref:Uncharacterized protein n=1 Tax=Aureobasidium vineae TaxID=2773715 RepID=A0A9N8JA74_9PEZI|nr:unnamed protein product [Aureobasidium vineae]